MRMFLLCCLATALGFGAVGNVQPQRALLPLSQARQSEDVSLLKPGHLAFADAMEFARFLNDKGIGVRSMHRSKLESLFQGIEKAAFFRTKKGVIEVIFFPDPRGAEKIKVTEQRRSGRYLYSFQGQPNPKPGDGFDADRPMHFLMHRNWFIVPDGEELYDTLKRALIEG